MATPHGITGHVDEGERLGGAAAAMRSSIRRALWTDESTGSEAPSSQGPTVRPAGVRAAQWP